MADVVLNITIKDAKVARVKQLIERFYFNGAVQTSAKIKTFIETKLADFVKTMFLGLDERAKKIDDGHFDPLT